MKKLIVTLTFVCAICAPVFAGVGYSAAEPAPCPEWYGDTEWTVSFWGTYAFTGTEYAPNPDLLDIVQSASEGNTVYGTFDRYIGKDHAWGAGADIKYFLYRYFGVGVEGFLLDASRDRFELESNGVNVFVADKTTEDRLIGEVLGTLTLRYPLRCSRLSPYAWAGGGAIFGGGESDTIIFDGFIGPAADIPTYHTVHSGSTTKAVGQFGAGMEVRITRHVGWVTDYSWNVVDGPKNNFGMFRTGVSVNF